MSWEAFIRAAESFLDAFVGRGWFVSRVSQMVIDRMKRALININFMKDLKSFIEEQGGLTLSKLLLRSAMYEVTDARDRVYGLLGLMPPTTRSWEHSLLEVNYESTNTEAKVLLNATKFAMVHESSFHLLELAGIGYTSGNVSRINDKPSWVPEWGQWHMNFIGVAVSECNKLYRTANYAPPVITTRDDEKTLEIRAMHVGEIKKLSPIWTHGVLLSTGKYQKIEELLYIVDSFLDYIEDACRFASEANSILYEHEHETLVWKTICHDSRRTIDQLAPTFEVEGRVIRELIQNLRQLIQSGRSFTDPLHISELSFAFQRLQLKLYPITGKRLCISSQGYFGIVPPYAREEDQIWAFSGAPNPFILRPSGDSSIISSGRPKYELVGACYIHGIMYGELEYMDLKPVVIDLI